MDIVILSNQRFDYPLKTNKWHVATRLAKLGHRVVFVDPPIRIRKVLKLLLKKEILFTDIIKGYKKVKDNLYVFMPITIYPTEKPNLFSFNYSKLRRLFELLKFRSGDYVLWVYHQVMLDYVNALRYKVLIYDCVDEYSKFPNFIERGLSKYVSEKEEIVARKANVVFATTEKLVEKMKRFNTNVHFTPNVGDYGRFKIVKTGVLMVPNELRELNKPIIGFSGAIDEYKLNLNLVIKCIKNYLDYSFVFVGPLGVSESKVSKLFKEMRVLKNVHFLGQKPYSEMPLYFEGFDVYIIPYNLNDYTLGGCFPVKFHDALSAGLPTVVTALPSFDPFKDVCYISKDDEDFVCLIEKALKENSFEKMRKRREVAKKNNWDEKVKLQLKLINACFLV
ncbi:MAG: glycosyltransferase [bacterium]